jgi:hypothetical protein
MEMRQSRRACKKTGVKKKKRKAAKEIPKWKAARESTSIMQPARNTRS